MPTKGISDARDPIEDIPDYPKGDQLPGGRSWPPARWSTTVERPAAAPAEALRRIDGRRFSVRSIPSRSTPGKTEALRTGSTRIYSNEGGLTGLDPHDELDAT